jgi:hypothetical protein
MSYSSRLYMYGPVGLLLLIVVLYAVFWRVQSDTLAARLERANGGEILPGVSFSFAQKLVGGFPFRLDVVLTDVAFTYRNGGTEADWRIDRLALHRLSYGRNQFIFEADGKESLAWKSSADAAPETVSLTPQVARASAILADDRLIRFDADVWDPRGTATDPRHVSSAFSAARAQFHALARRNNTVDVMMQIENGQSGANGAQAAVPQIDCRAEIDHAEMLTGLERGNEAPATALQKWRDNLGVINVSSLSLNWPDAHAMLRGILTLNSQERLAGVLRGDWSGKNQKTQPMELRVENGSFQFRPG